MTDIGDDVAVTTTVRVDGTLTDPATIVLTVTDPDGVVSTPSIDHPSVGEYRALVPATAAGRWSYVWETTDPTGVEHGHFDVRADPPPPGRLAALAAVTDLEARLGRPLTDTEAARAQTLLGDASALVRRYTRQDFDLTEGDEVVLRPVGTVLRLPQRPVLSVTSVAALSGRDDIADIPLPGWTWDGIDKIDIAGINAATFISLPEWWWDWDSGAPNTYRVVYDHGYPTTPDDIVAVVAGMANRVLLAPSMVEGLTSERIGQYGYQFAQFPGGQSPGATVRLAQADKDALIDAGYKRTAGTIQLRT